MSKQRTFHDVSKNTTRDGEPWEQLSPNTDHTLLLHIYAESHTLIKRGCKCLEQRWKKFILESKSRGKIDVFTWVLPGERIVESYNAYQVDEEKHIRLVITISKSLYYCPH